MKIYNEFKGKILILKPFKENGIEDKFFDENDKPNILNNNKLINNE